MKKESRTRAEWERDQSSIAFWATLVVLFIRGVSFGLLFSGIGLLFLTFTQAIGLAILGFFGSWMWPDRRSMYEKVLGDLRKESENIRFADEVDGGKVL